MQNTRITKPALAVFLLRLIYLGGTQAQAQSPLVPLDAAAIAIPLISELSQQFNLTPPIDDYVRQNQRQYEANIVGMDAELAAYKSSYLKELGTISSQNELLMLRLHEVDNKLYPMEHFDDLHRHCVHQYAWQLATPLSVQRKIQSCVDMAVNSFSTYSNTPIRTRDTLNNHYNVVLVNALNACKKNNAPASQNYTNCAVQAIAAADAATSTNLNNFQKQMHSSQCSAEERVRTAVSCSFSATYDAVSATGAATRLVDNCLAGLDFCPECEPGTDVPNPDSDCPNDMMLSLNATDYASATINNPFFGYNSNITCVRVHLLQPI